MHSSSEVYPIYSQECEVRGYSAISVTTVTFNFIFLILTVLTGSLPDSLCHTRLSTEAEPTASPPAACGADTACFAAHIPYPLIVKRKLETPLCSTVCGKHFFPPGCVKVVVHTRPQQQMWSRGRLQDEASRAPRSVSVGTVMQRCIMSMPPICHLNGVANCLFSASNLLNWSITVTLKCKMPVQILGDKPRTGLQF